MRPSIRRSRARQSASRLHHHHRRLRQIVRLLRGAVHARAGAQPHQRKRFERSSRARAHGLHRNSAAGPERQQLSRSVARRLGFRALAARRGRRGRHPARALHHVASARFREGHRRRHRRNPVLCNHVHLPVQSGSSDVLARMQRLYTRDEYMRRIDWMKKARRNIAITTDIIVGFPGETEADFDADARAARRSGIRFAVQLQVLAPPQHRRA